MTYFQIINIIASIFTIIFAIRISNFKKDAWLFYLLSFVISSSSFFVYNDNISISEYFDSISLDFYDILISLFALLYCSTKQLKTKIIRSHNILKVIIFLIVAITLFTSFTLLSIPIEAFNKPEIIIIQLFELVNVISLALLAIGFIEGLLIQVAYYIGSIIISIYLYNLYNNYNIYFLVSPLILDSFMTIIFIKGYIKNIRLFSQ